MKTKPTKNNPWSCSRYSYLYEILNSRDNTRHLDYGCYNGNVIKKLMDCGVISLGVGVDKNKQALKKAENENGNSECRFCHIDHVDQIAHVVNGVVFTSVSLLDVLEHVHDQDSLLQNIKKVMGPGAILVVTVPKKNIFSFLDLGNWKFVFPLIHKYFYILKYSRPEYEQRYVICADGLIGDVEKEKRWHQHFSVNELCELLSNNGFDVMDVDGSGFFVRQLSILKLLIPVSGVKKILDQLIAADARAFSSSNLFITAKVK